MARTFNGSTDYLAAASTPVTDAPMTIAAWYRVASFGVDDQDIIGCFSSGSNKQMSLSVEPGSSLRIRAFNGADLGDRVILTGGTSTGVWYHAAGVFTSTSSRTPYLNGVAGTPETTMVVQSGIDSISIGRRGTTAVNSYFPGEIADAAIWNVALTATEIAALAAGVPASMIRPESLVFYPPIFGIDSPEPDLTSGHRNLTLGGSPAFAAGPPVQPYLYVPQEWTARTTAPTALATRRALLGVGV